MAQGLAGVLDERGVQQRARGRFVALVRLGPGAAQFRLAQGLGLPAGHAFGERGKAVRVVRLQGQWPRANQHLPQHQCIAGIGTASTRRQSQLPGQRGEGLHLLHPPRRLRAEHGQAHAQVLATLVVVGGGGQHRPLVAGGARLAGPMEGMGIQGQVERMRADFVARKQHAWR